MNLIQTFLNLNFNNINNNNKKKLIYLKLILFYFVFFYIKIIILWYKNKSKKKMNVCFLLKCNNKLCCFVSDFVWGRFCWGVRILQSTCFFCCWLKFEFILVKEHWRFDILTCTFKTKISYIFTDDFTLFC